VKVSGKQVGTEEEESSGTSTMIWGTALITKQFDWKEKEGGGGGGFPLGGDKSNTLEKKQGEGSAKGGTNKKVGTFGFQALGGESQSEKDNGQPTVSSWATKDKESFQW